MAILLNRAKGYKRDVNTVVIDRSGPWGNPFVIDVDGDRAEVCRLHKDWLNAWMKDKKEIQIIGFSNRWVMEHLQLLKGKDLACWCTPSQCHGDYLLWLASKEV